MPSQRSKFVRSTLVLMIIGFVALLAIVGTTIWLGERVHDYFSIVIEARDTRDAAAELRYAVQGAESSQRGFLVTGNEIYLAPYAAAKAMVSRQMSRLEKNILTYPALTATFHHLKQVIDEKMQEMDSTIVLKRAERGQDAASIVRNNRGKALMDEANVFISGITRAADERLTQSVSEQTNNVSWLRWVALLGGFVIVSVVGTAILALFRYARKLAEARDEVGALNQNLEKRVADRTADLALARDRAELLLSEVNHRVANSLSLVASLVRLQGNAAKQKATQDALNETQARIFAIAFVHKKLYSSGDVRVVALDEYLQSLLDHLEASMRDEGHGASLKMNLEALKLPTDASINLGVIVAEWVTNAFKYAYPGKAGEIRVALKHLQDNRIELSVEDDGIGRQENVPAQGTGLGTKIVKAMAANMQADIQYSLSNPGTRARLVFSPAAA